MAESQKVEFALEVSKRVTELSDLCDKIRGMYKLWSTRGYKTGGSDPITDADLAGFTDIINEKQLVEWEFLAANLIKFLDNNSPGANLYQSRLDKMRDEVF